MTDSEKPEAPASAAATETSEAPAAEPIDPQALASHSAMLTGVGRGSRLPELQEILAREEETPVEILPSGEIRPLSEHEAVTTRIDTDAVVDNVVAHLGLNASEEAILRARAPEPKSEEPKPRRVFEAEVIDPGRAFVRKGSEVVEPAPAPRPGRPSADVADISMKVPQGSRVEIAGWEVVCPDDRVRHYPFHNFDDAEDTARLAKERRCRLWPEPSPIELAQPPCPEGKHRVRPVKFSPPIQSSAGPETGAGTTTGPETGARTTTNLFDRGEKIANDVDKVAATLEGYAPGIAEKGHKAAETLRAVAEGGRRAADHVGALASEAKRTAAALEEAGVPVSKIAAKLWQTSPLPGFGPGSGSGFGKDE